MKLFFVAYDGLDLIGQSVSGPPAAGVRHGSALNNKISVDSISAPMHLTRTCVHRLKSISWRWPRYAFGRDLIGFV